MHGGSDFLSNGKIPTVLCGLEQSVHRVAMRRDANAEAHSILLGVVRDNQRRLASPAFGTEAFCCY